MEIQYKVLEDNILYYEGILSDPDTLINLINETDSLIDGVDLLEKWEDWKSSNDDYIFGQRKFSNPEKYDVSSDELRYIYNTLTSTLAAAGAHYAEYVGVPMGVQAPISISKYYSGSGMGPHTDAGPIAHLSAVLYLNDDYDGGELAFPNHGIIVKPSAGSIIMFPSVEPYVHDPRNVISGEKYIAPSFWFKNW